MPTLMDILFSEGGLVTILAGVMAFATVITLGRPLIHRGTLERRMKEVAMHRELMRSRRKADLRARRLGLRTEAVGWAKVLEEIVSDFNLSKLVESDDIREKLQLAGLRGNTPVTIFMFFRFAMPVVLFLLALVYVNFIAMVEWAGIFKLAVAIGAALFGFYLPDLFVKNLTVKRQAAIMAGFPDALDLLLICVESGMSAEMAFNRVSTEIGRSFPVLAEEFALTTAELSYLPDRKQAFENFARRSGNESVQAVASALNQSEKYGTPLGQALRICAKENREARMSKAEQKAAALPAKLTVPMILFFLPCLFVVILGPAIMKVMHVM
jgi:tight adherence protein C